MQWNISSAAVRILKLNPELRRAVTVHCAGWNGGAVLGPELHCSHHPHATFLSSVEKRELWMNVGTTTLKTQYILQNYNNELPMKSELMLIDDTKSCFQDFQVFFMVF